MSLKLNIKQPENKHTALVDGDIIIYKAAWVGEKEDSKSDALSAARDLMNKIKDDLDVDNEHVIVYFSDKVNFRKSLWPLYKYNRVDTKKPKYLELVKNFLSEEYITQSEPHLEADDLLAHQMGADVPCVCCSIDKDLLQIEGLHYNINKRTITEITQEQGLYNLAMQALTGDSVDNIKGCPGIGPKKAEKILEGMDSDNWIERCVEAYRHVYGDDAGEVFCMNLSLVYLQTDIELAWLPIWPRDCDSYVMEQIPYDQVR